jgi:hypothetical protein
MHFVMENSRATEGFKQAIAGFVAGDRPERVHLETYVPRVKVERLLMQLLSAEPSLEIEQVVIRGMSGCSDFVGSVDVRTPTGTHVFDFVWCCRWRAESEGYVDYFGFPDQLRAAREFDWRCFQRWERRVSN